MPTASGAILVVEDDSDIRSAVMLLLEHEGFAVHGAADGLEALTLAQSVRPRLVLLDLNLPTLDGAQVLERLREAPETAAVPVVIVSAQIAEYLPRLPKGTYTAALPKPVEPGELLQLVRRLAAPRPPAAVAERPLSKPAPIE